MKRLFTSSKWLAVIIASVVAGVAAATDKITPEQCFQIIQILVLAGIGGTALEDGLKKAKGIFIGSRD